MRILVAGNTGLAGRAIYERLRSSNCNVIGLNSKVVDLLDQKATLDFLMDNRPDIVIDAAAYVGGIAANDSQPVSFLSRNVLMQTHLMNASHAANVNRLLFLGSSCIYPRNCPQPIKEEYLLSGYLERSNSAYAIAKIAGVELVKAYRKQYKREWISIMPCNLYGPHDNFNLETGHVLPALVNKFVSAVDRGVNKVEIWGSGNPRREFLHVSDLAEAVVIVLEKYNEDSHLNIGFGSDISIRELAEKIATISNFRGEISWNSNKPDGVERKVLDVSRITSLGWKPKVALDEGISSTIDWFRGNSREARL